MDIVERLQDHARNVGGDASFERLYGNEAVEAASEIARLREENKVLRDALEPFAQEAAFWPDGNRDSTGIGPTHRINVGHLRRASSALATTGGE